MTLLKFETRIIEINTWNLVVLPEGISKELPSRGMVMIEGTLQNMDFKAPLEPDGRGSHYLRLKEDFLKEAGLKTGDLVALSIKPMKLWCEPDLPEDLALGLKVASLEEEWALITTKARWAWIRWVRATNRPETRQKRIKTACSMLRSGKKRPCCFDQSKCTETQVSKQGILCD